MQGEMSTISIDCSDTRLGIACHYLLLGSHFESGLPIWAKYFASQSHSRGQHICKFENEGGQSNQYFLHFSKCCSEWSNSIQMYRAQMATCTIGVYIGKYQIYVCVCACEK